MNKLFLRLAVTAVGLLLSAPVAFAGVSDRLPANYRETAVLF
jgi:hypothetical protein